MTKRIAIIGAGIAGLSTGIFAQQKGYNTEIFELHDIPGGECTSWKRGDYTIDGCVYYLIGSKQTSSIIKLWEAVGVFPETVVVNNEIFMSCLFPDKLVEYFSNFEKLESSLIQNFPEDATIIREIVKYSKVLADYQIPVDRAPKSFRLKDFTLLVSKLPYLLVMNKYSKITVREYLKKIKNHYFRESLSLVVMQDYTVFFLFTLIANLCSGNAGYPIGGSFPLVKKMEKKYLSLGGKIHYSREVEKIIVENNRAVGLKTVDGKEYSSDIIISAADGYSTIFKLLEGKYVSKRLCSIYNNKKKFPTYSSVQCTFGINDPLINIPSFSWIKLPESINLGGLSQNYLSFRNYKYDPTLYPKNKGIITVLLESDYYFWKTAKDSGIYESLKTDLAEYIKNFIYENFPELFGKIEIWDVATPLTYERYTRAANGSYLSWIMTPHLKPASIINKLPGLKNFYMCGQWTLPPGGLLGAVTSAKWTVDELPKILQNH